MICKDVTYSETTGFDHNGDSFKMKCERMMGGSGEGVYTKGSLHAN